MDFKRKAFTPQFKAADDAGNVEFVVATLNVVDHDKDVTLPGFFGHQDVQVLPAHDRTHVPLGKGVIREEGQEAIASVKFNLDIPAARDWHSAIKFDMEHPPSLQEYSYGFRVRPGGAKSGSFEGQSVNFLQPLEDGTPGGDVFEVSPVLRGAGMGTRTLAVKGLKQPHSEIYTALRNAGRERFGAEDTYVWAEDYDPDESWVVFEISNNEGADRLVRVNFTRSDDGAIALGDEERDVERTVGYAPKGADRFTEHAKSVVADVSALVSRATEVMALRSAKGKGVSPESAGPLRQIVEEVKRLEELLVEPTPPNNDEVAREFARFVSITNGAIR